MMKGLSGLLASALPLFLLAGFQAAGAQAPSRFKNIQVLKGMSDAEIQRTMASWAKQLGVKCTACHVQGDFATDEMKQKKTARLMYQMVQVLNQQDFFKAGERKADCFLCHKGNELIPASP
jgi:hypothetical protein